MANSTNSPFGQGEIEKTNNGIVPIHALTSTQNPTRADDSITTSALNVAITDTVKSLTVEHIEGERVLIKVKTSTDTTDVTTSNYDYAITDSIVIRDWAIPTLNKEGEGYPTHISLATASATAIVSIRFK